MQRSDKPPETPCQPPNDGNLTRSAEWDAIMSQNLLPGEVMLISATAGAGKSTALREYTRMRPGARTLYLTFSKDSQVEMQTQYDAPGLQHVDVRTVSSLVWEATNKALNFGFGSGKALGPQLHNPRVLQAELYLKKHISDIMGDREGTAPRTQADCDLVVGTLDAFFASTDPVLAACHVKKCASHEKMISLLGMAQRVWAAMIDPNETRWPLVTHGMAGKYFQLHPELQDCVFGRYDLVLVDESHDLTPAQMHPISCCACAKVIVYDVHQSIYGWRGARAVDDIVQLTAVCRCRLSQTWRYGAPVSVAAAAMVSRMKGFAPGDFTITGKPGHVTTMAVAGKPLVCGGRLAVLARMNMTLFDAAVGLLDSQPELKLHFLGHDSPYGWIVGGRTALMEVFNFRWDGVPLPNLSFFTSFSDYKVWLQRIGNYSKLAVCKLVETYGHRLLELMARIDAAHVCKAVQKVTPADVILSTVHKAKGLGFPEVYLCDDILTESLCEIGAALRVQNSLKSTCGDEWVETGQLLCDLRHLLGQKGVDVDGEVNLVYVGITRAETKLTVGAKLGAWLDVCGVSFGDSVSRGGVCYD